MVKNLKERDHVGDTDVGEEDHIKIDFKSDGKVWTELIWSNTGTSSGLLWTRQCVEGGLFSIELLTAIGTSNLKQQAYLPKKKSDLH